MVDVFFSGPESFGVEHYDVNDFVVLIMRN
jgi:hypothetical protein